MSAYDKDTIARCRREGYDAFLHHGFGANVYCPYRPEDERAMYFAEGMDKAYMERVGRHYEYDGNPETGEAE